MLFLERDPLVSTEWSRDGASNSRPQAVNLQHAPRRATLWLWIVIVALMHFDRGVAAVAAMDIRDWDGQTVLLSFGYSVELLAWHSVGMASGYVLAGFTFRQVSAKSLLVMALLVNAAALAMLGTQVEMHFIVISFLRAISGFAASMPLVFLPLWVDEYGPSDNQAQWLALVQMGAPIGQFIGGIVASILTAFMRERRGLDWRFALLIQAILVLAVTIRLMFVPSIQVNVSSISSLRTRLDSLTMHSAEGGLVRESREMLQGISRNPLNMAMSTTLVLLHATASGLLLWSAPYLSLSRSAPPAVVALLAVNILLAVAPLFGMYIGALICDRLEGFKAGHHASALRVACAFLVVASIPALASSHAEDFAPRLAVIGLWFVCAGAFLPICTGVLMTSMPSYLRSFSASSSAIVTHSLSFAAVPMISGGLMSCFANPVEGLNFGMAFTLWLTVPAAFILLVTYVREPKNTSPAGLSGADDLCFTEINYEMSRRRMSTTPM